MLVVDSFKIKGIPCVIFYKEKCQVGDKLMCSKTGEVYTVIKTDQITTSMGRVLDDFAALLSGDKVPEQNSNLYLVGRDND